MSSEDLERYETEIELQLYKEYRDVLPMFTYVVETERRFYLTNSVKLNARTENGQTYNLQLDKTQSFAGESFHLAADSGTGTALTLTEPPTVQSIVATPPSGDLAPGKMVVFTVTMSQAVTLGGLTGPFGVVDAPAPWPRPYFDAAGGLYPVFHVLRGLAGLAGRTLRQAESSAPGLTHTSAIRVRASPLVRSGHRR